MEQSFIQRINHLEEQKDIPRLKIELMNYKWKDEERFYIASAIAFLTEKTISEVKDLLLY